MLDPRESNHPGYGLWNIVRERGRTAGDAAQQLKQMLRGIAQTNKCDKEQLDSMLRLVDQALTGKS